MAVMGLGYTQGNFVGLEDLLPCCAPEWKMEDEVIERLIGDSPLRVELLVQLETYMCPHFHILFIHHERLFIPLWYKLGEGDKGFVSRLQQRKIAGDTLGMVCVLDGLTARASQ
jgi:hypothetical protein